MVSQAELEQIRFQQLLDFQKQLYQQFQDFQSKTPVMGTTSPREVLKPISSQETVATKSQDNIVQQRHEVPCSRGTNTSNVNIPQYSKQNFYENVPQKNHAQCRRNVNSNSGISKSVKENGNVINFADLMNHFTSQQHKNPTPKKTTESQETRPVINVEDFLKQLGINLNQYEQKDTSKQVPQRNEQNQKPVNNDKQGNNFCSNIQNLVNSFAKNMTDSAYPKSETVEKKHIPKDKKSSQSVPIQEPAVKRVQQSKPAPVEPKIVPIQPQPKVEEEPESVKSFKRLEKLAEQVESIISNVAEKKKKETELMKILLELDSISCNFVLRPIRKSLVESINKELDSLQKTFVSSENLEESPKEEVKKQEESVNEKIEESHELEDIPNEPIEDKPVENELSPSNPDSENESNDFENPIEEVTEESIVPSENGVEADKATISNEEENLTFGLIAPYMNNDNASESDVSPAPSEVVPNSEVMNEENNIEERDEVVEEKSEHEDVLIEDVEDDDDSFETTETVNTNNLVENGFVFVSDTPGNPDETDESNSVLSENILNDSLPVLDEVQA